MVTILVSLMTRPKPESELRSLVYGLTELPRQEGVKWFRRPAVIASAAAVLCILLNFLFW